ncbi:hypothetical protein AVEN_154084-1 [Araneus ventricosus]|uniref:Uncharacterized protein n=1 Tax=Araneus ventricosus TaxID=182803 RepID=A0A4Y2J3U3_ARAVE|nr:hypothetical protein AVEN_154084-1 [Araneus ventricosus]
MLQKEEEKVPIRYGYNPVASELRSVHCFRQFKGGGINKSQCSLPPNYHNSKSLISPMSHFIIFSPHFLYLLLFSSVCVSKSRNFSSACLYSALINDL